MSAITLRVDTSQLRPDFMAYGEASLRAAVRGMNRTAKNVQTVMVRACAKSLRIKQSYVRDRISILEATRNKPVVRMYADNKQIPLIAFGAKGPYPSRGKGGGVRAKTATGVYPHAFIAVMPNSGHRGVFERVRGQFMMSNPRREKIRERKEASVAAVFVHHASVGQARADEMLPRNLEAELKFALSKR